jgi:hypothetical protein
MKTTTFASLLLAGTALGSPAQQKRDTVTAQVNFANNTGKPQHLASGILYGLPDTANQIPTKFYTDMGFNYNRAGGAQVPAPGRGWIWGLNEYKVLHSLTPFPEKGTLPDNDRPALRPRSPTTKPPASTVRNSSS